MGHRNSGPASWVAEYPHARDRQYHSNAPPDSTNGGKLKALIMSGAVAALGLALTGCAESRPTSLEKATTECLQAGGRHWEVQDEGNAVHLQVERYDQGVKRDEAECVLKAVGASDSTLTKMRNTQVSDGEQTASWDGYEARWTGDDAWAGSSIQITAKK